MGMGSAALRGCHCACLLERRQLGLLQLAALHLLDVLARGAVGVIAGVARVEVAELTIWFECCEPFTVSFLALAYIT